MADQSSNASSNASSTGTTTRTHNITSAANGTLGFKKWGLEPLCHVTATEPVADNLASVPISKSSGQIEFVYENPGADSLQFNEPIRLYPCKLCDVKCKRPYDLDRHHQTKHAQSQHWFCPVDTCKLSRAVPGLSEILNPCDLGFSSYWCRSYRRPLTHEVLHTEFYGGTKLRLHGFSRRDKLIKHLKKAHQEEILLLGATPYGKGLSHTQPLICEIQRFWAHRGTGVPDSGQKWSPKSLCRSQVDGKWSEFDGRDLKAVAEAGFRRWTKDVDESYRRLVRAPKFHDVLPWKAHDRILELNDGSNQPDLPMDSLSAERSIQASSSGLEDSPWSTANTQAQSLFDMGVEEIVAAFDWEAFLNSDLNSGIDMKTVASDHAGVSAFDINGLNSGFDFNYSALENGAVADLDIDFNDPNSVPHWYFSAEDGVGPDI